MTTEIIEPDLFDLNNKDNQRFLNLLDDYKWRRLIRQMGDIHTEGSEKEFVKNFQSMLESR